MNECIHILQKGPRKNQTCNKTAWFPFFYRCYCKQHALINNIPMTIKETNMFIKDIKDKIDTNTNGKK